MSEGITKSLPPSIVGAIAPGGVFLILSKNKPIGVLSRVREFVSKNL